MPEEEWLECVPWDGVEKSLPLGAIITIPNFSVSDLVKSYTVIDKTTEEGIRKTKSPSRTDAVIDVEINEKLFDAITSNFGRDVIKFTDADSGEKLNRWEWKEKHGTDALKLLAIRNHLRGGGILRVGGR